SYGPGRRPLESDPQKSLAHECRRLQAKWGITEFVADPADPGANFDLQRSGINVRGASNNVAHGIRKMSEVLHVLDGQPRFVVFDTCKNFIREAKAWQWGTTRDGGEFTEEPAANQSDHALDAARYAIMELRRYAPTGFERPLAAAVPLR